MFNRLSRMFRSFFGFFISVAENPELILEQNIRDMNDQVPRMNESIAMVKARFPDVNVLPSSFAALVTCTDFSSRFLRRLSSRVANARNFSAPRLKGSVNATKRALAETWALTDCTPSNSSNGGALWPSISIGEGSDAVNIDRPFSGSDLCNASCIRLTLSLLQSSTRPHATESNLQFSP